LESVDHLKPWMPWAHEEPKTLEERVALLRTFRGKFDLGEDFVYGIFNIDESQVLGGTGLHTRRGEGVREIGYWIHSAQINRGFATESTAALVKVAFDLHQVRRVEIRCDPGNTASSAIPRKLGFSFEGVLRNETVFLGAARDTQVWSLIDADYEASSSSMVKVAVFDAMGRTLIDTHRDDHL
jgi:RimJ/RimL family protein N-acetyltransferase